MRGRRFDAGNTISDDQAARWLGVRDDDLLAIGCDVKGFDEEVRRGGHQGFHCCSGGGGKTLADDILPPLADVDEGMAVAGKSGALAAGFKLHGRAIGEPHHEDLRPERGAHNMIEGVLAVEADVGPSDPTPDDERSVGSIHADFI